MKRASMRSARALWTAKRRAARSTVLLTVLLCLAPIAALAGIHIPAGSSIQLNGGKFGVAGDVVVDGQLTVDDGQLNGVQSLRVHAGGALSGGSGLIELAGNWQVDGNFDPGSGTVRFIDGPTLTSLIMGSNHFAKLSLVSALGKHFVVEPGSVQQIALSLEISGIPSNPLQIERLPSGAVGVIDLIAGATQTIANVGVSNVHATGQPLAPTLTNEGGSGNATGWFGSVAAQPGAPVPEMIPATSPATLFLIFLLVVVALRLRGTDATRSL